MSDEVELLSRTFASIGLDSVKSVEAAKNKKLSALLSSILTKANVIDTGCDRAKGQLFYLLATKITKESMEHLDFLTDEIQADRLRTELQLSEAIRYCHRTNHIERETFDRVCGINVEVGEKEICEAVEKVLQEAQLNTAQQGMLIRQVKEIGNVKWADGKLVKQIFDEKYAASKAANNTITSTSDVSISNASANDSTASSLRTFEGDVLRLHKPGENKQKSEEIMKKHLQITGGKVITRFPPEPNGFLHIGHAKAINLNFRYAEAHQGHCYLRYDDTNPEAEEQLYFDSILDTVHWLGFKPYRVTHASDYFPQLYEYAVELIRRGKAYVCHMTPEQIRESRGGDDMKGPRYDSPWRNRPIEESLRLFEDMRQGKVAEESATLRMKQDMQSVNPFMWDLVAYRILRKPHVRTGDEWVIYPTYDFTHCLCDSLENITHSLCTTEFIKAHECYDWVCDSLDVYKAFQWEYSRLNITNTVLSKRKLTQLVQLGIVKSWDDPRLYTLAALRRRGFSASAINNFVERLGITTSASTVDVRLLEHCVREDLNENAPRLFAALDPIEVELENYAQSAEIFVPYFPSNSSRTFSTRNGTESSGSSITFNGKLFIDSADFRISRNDDAEYKRLYPGGCVGLLRANVVIRCKRYEMNNEGKVTRIIAECVSPTECTEKVTFIQWVPQLNSVRCEVRIYSNLFQSRNPSDNPQGWLADVNPDSLHVVDAVIDPRAMQICTQGQTVQFTRIGYFCVDPDTDLNKSKLVFNRTVPLKE